MYSVIIPTMWRSDYLGYMLHACINHSLVGEIIIINNDDPNKSGWFSFAQEKDTQSKIRVITPPTNIGVNPAWNLGVLESKFDKICFLSDDVEFDVNVFNFLSDKLEESDGLVGIGYPPFPREGSTHIETIQKLVHGYGSLMFFNKKNYKPIPDEFKIFYGDVMMFIESVKAGKQPRLVYPIFAKTEMATTSASPEFARQTEIEHALWMQHVGIEPSKFFH